LDAVAKLQVQDAIIDGEIVALNEKGISSFQLLQAYELGQERPPIFFYAFDLLQLDGKDLRNEPITRRKALLEKLLKRSRGVLRYSASLEGDISHLLCKGEELGLEGLIGKRKDSLYETGERSGNWIKLKFLKEQEMVIGGYTDPEGARNHFGALLVGYYERGELRFAGMVGTGFNHELLKSLLSLFRKISQKACPFVNLPEKKAGKWNQGVTPAEMKRCHWLKPALVCQVKFAEWTRDGKLRQPVFLGLREDKDAMEVIRERAGK
jgi:bifunctional non-homologous end joining protein LigD